MGRQKINEEQLEMLLDRRSQLNDYLTKEKNRLEKGVSCIRNSITKIIAVIESEIQQIENNIREVIQSDDDLRNKSAIVQSVKGVGEITAWTILGYLKEIDLLNRNQLIALAGVAPYNKDSGSRSMKRSIYGGRAKVRRSLYMAATVAARHNVVIKAYVAGLLARGKHYKVAMVAAMRKLLIHIQGLLKKRHNCP